MLFIKLIFTEITENHAVTSVNMTQLLATLY